MYDKTFEHFILPPTISFLFGFIHEVKSFAMKIVFAYSTHTHTHQKINKSKLFTLITNNRIKNNISDAIPRAMFLIWKTQRLQAILLTKGVERFITICFNFPFI